MIVYVDDEPALCKVFSRILMRAGAEVVAFTNPVEALAWLADNPATAIVCDYRMPQMTGIQFLDRVGQQVPFYFVSGDLAAAEELRGDPRIHGILAKPFRPERLVQLLAAHM